MRTIYFLLGVSFSFICFIIHNKIDCQNVTCLDDDLKSDGEIRCDNSTDETELNSTTVTTTAAPTKQPKRSDRDVIQCPPLPITRLPNGRIRLLHNERVKYVCNHGYKLVGPSIVRCFEGRWTNEIEPMCILPASSCGPPEAIPHGTIYGNYWTHESRIIYICDQGYTLLGSRERTCENGYWSTLPPTCEDNSEPLKDMAERLKEQFVEKVGSYSSDSRGRSIGSDIRHTGLELLLLIDRSSSVDPVDFKQGIEFAKYLVNEFGVRNGKDANSTGTRIAIITFGDRATLVVKPDDASIQNKHDAGNRLDSLEPGGGGTAMSDALATVIMVIPSLRPKAKKAIFLLTDGQNNVGNIPPSSTAKDLKANGVEIFTVGVGRDINKDELVSIASEPARNHVFLLKQFKDLDDIMWLIRNSPPPAPPVGPATCGILTKFKGKFSPEAVPGWPWLAVIYVKHPPKNHRVSRMGICSGSLICSQWVLTSGSCFYGEDESAGNSKFQKAYVTLGEDDLTKRDKTQTNFRISDVLFHPEFHPWNGSDYDIALVKLARPAKLELTYRPVCVPTADQLISIRTTADSNGIMAGWGANPSISFFNGNFASAFKISPQVTKMPFVEDSMCKKVKPKNATNTFCAGPRIGRTCSGNLGSPLVVKDSTSNIHYVIGVLSTKKFCRSHYNMFTDVLPHVSWIKNVTQACQKSH